VTYFTPAAPCRRNSSSALAVVGDELVSAQNHRVAKRGRFSRNGEGPGALLHCHKKVAFLLGTKVIYDPERDVERSLVVVPPFLPRFRSRNQLYPSRGIALLLESGTEKPLWRGTHIVLLNNRPSTVSVRGVLSY